MRVHAVQLISVYTQLLANDVGTMCNGSFIIALEIQELYTCYNIRVWAVHIGTYMYTYLFQLHNN